jgi:hypothetical protein
VYNAGNAGSICVDGFLVKKCRTNAGIMPDNKVLEKSLIPYRAPTAAVDLRSTNENSGNEAMQCCFHGKSWKR